MVLPATGLGTQNQVGSQGSSRVRSRISEQSKFESHLNLCSDTDLTPQNRVLSDFFFPYQVHSYPNLEMRDTVLHH